MLQAFQEETVSVAISALTQKRGARRFLVADEVGLGKTVIAASIAHRLAQQALHEGKSFCVVYFGSNLQLVAQNKTRFLPAAEHPLARQTRALDSQTNRISLAWQWQPTEKLRLALFTPSTSLPDMEASSFGTGTKLERATAAAWARFSMGRTLDREVRVFLAGGARRPGPAASRVKLDEFDQLVLATARKIQSDIRQSKSMIMRMSRTFLSSLAESLKIEGRIRGRSLRKEIRARLESSNRNSGARLACLADIRKALRVALCRATLERGVLKPDLIILDEFQNYPQLLNKVNDASLAKSVFSDAAVLMLSATPFAWHRGGDATAPLHKIVEFLTKDASEANCIRNSAAAFRNAILRNEDERSRATWLKSVQLARDKLEGKLRPILERTERWDDELMAAPIVARPHPLPIPADLVIFDDLARRLQSARSHQLRAKGVAHATPLWMSLPYPTQTLPAGYVVSRALAQAQIKRTAAPNLRRPVDGHSPRRQEQALNHPKLRCFLSEVSPEKVLALPWVAPSLPWWRLAGEWREAEDREPKSIVFARYRATPPAISGLVSFAIERATGSKFVKWSDIPRRPRFIGRKGNRNDELRSLFHPWMSLAMIFDPLGVEKRTSEEILDVFVKQARSRFRLTRKSSAHESVMQKLRRYELQHVNEGESRLVLPARLGLRKGSDSERVAKLALAGPGTVLVRALYRHYGPETKKHLSAIGELSWNALRPYLGRRYFDGALARHNVRGFRSRSAADRDSLLDAIVAGNFEAVLDEHIATFRLLNSTKSGLLDVLAHLKEALTVSDGALALHENTTKKRRIVGRLRAHAALAFAGQEAAKSGTLRPNQLQAAFNSPFWPHVLTTTSVGQEGLDFHVWCSRVVHWDPPSDPISLEQREGRVARFASLSVRRALARMYEEAALSRAEGESFRSPWSRIIEIAKGYAKDRQGNAPGLRPWWVMKNGQYTRVVLAPLHSAETIRFDDLTEELALYRLAFGQPDPHQFVKKLAGKLTLPEIRALAVDISSLRLRRG
ncbi:DEAD/DEAH box helicase [Bradyrhizobium sp. IC3123]|uniref:DEAD/DEAH box helicase n=1 Tax=Bradyrhizobium sp. IC3123 TaxID=2793803 RepID=UPI001CD26F8A|nr:helicase-related protein [Bradyrhizobium sp. IC3123]MCA1393764.1 DEAD/DEAH box helicase [Bradyrhizobium sp. IC3123]